MAEAKSKNILKISTAECKNGENSEKKDLRAKISHTVIKSSNIFCNGKIKKESFTKPLCFQKSGINVLIIRKKNRIFHLKLLPYTSLIDHYFRKKNVQHKELSQCFPQKKVKILKERSPPWIFWALRAAPTFILISLILMIIKDDNVLLTSAVWKSPGSKWKTWKQVQKILKLLNLSTFSSNVKCILETMSPIFSFSFSPESKIFNFFYTKIQIS